MRQRHKDKRITVQLWEEKVRQLGLNPLPKFHIRGGYILLADGYRGYNEDEEYPQPHFLMFWGIERDGFDVAQKLFFSPFSSLQRRKERAVKVAKQWIEDNETVGRYT